MIQEIYQAEDLEAAVLERGFLPFFKNPIAGFSVEEMTPEELWFAENVDGPWEWKGPVVRGWKCAYGKLFHGKTGYVSLEWFPDLANYRRSRYRFEDAPIDEEGRCREREVYETIVAHESLLSKEIKRLCGFQSSRKKPADPLDILSVGRPRRKSAESLDTALARLQMATLLVIADFEYPLDKHGQPYGWGLARYVTPEALYGPEILSPAAHRSPAESRERLLAHLRALLPHATESQLTTLLD